MNQVQFTTITNFGNLSIGIADNKSWIICKGSHLLNLQSEDVLKSIFWLPLLEIDYSTFHEKLTSGLEKKVEKNEIEELLAAFPTNEMVNAALQSESIYWVQLALKWGDQIDNKSTLESALEQILDNKKFPQHIRHSSKKLLAKIRLNK